MVRFIFSIPYLTVYLLPIFLLIASEVSKAEPLMRPVSYRLDVSLNHPLYILGMYEWIALWRKFRLEFVFHSRNY